MPEGLTQIQPRFSITPEVLTHYRAYDLKNGSCKHVFEDVWFSSLSAEEIADYVGLALTILSRVGLDPQGMTSPWRCGIDNEDNYAAGIGMASAAGLYWVAVAATALCLVGLELFGRLNRAIRSHGEKEPENAG